MMILDYINLISEGASVSLNESLSFANSFLPFESASHQTNYDVF